MNDRNDKPQSEDRQDFLREAEADRTGLVGEFIDFLKHNKKWWMIPIILAVAVIGLLVFLSASPAAAPFIYTLF